MQFWTVDTFSKHIFGGNPAGVCIVSQFPSTEMMQKIATEINLPETVFVVPVQYNQYALKWFTPITEVNLCGHGILAAGHVLWNELNIPHPIVYFDSSNGILKAEKTPYGITLDFPALKCEPTPIPEGLINALGIAPVCLNKSHDDYIVELHSIKAVKRLKPDISKLLDVNCRGVVITADNDPENKYDFVSRFFAPRIGLNEDSVTASSHCMLATYWAERYNKNSFFAYQASPRGGEIELRYENDRIFVTAQAVTAFCGNFVGF